MSLQMIEISPPVLEHFCPFFMLFAQVWSLFAQMGSLFAQNPTPQLLFFSLPSCAPFGDMYVYYTPPHPNVAAWDTMIGPELLKDPYDFWSPIGVQKVINFNLSVWYAVWTLQALSEIYFP